ncbi:hypothetical protein MKW94_030417 [Papaver nudicaule]|uniref:BCAS3 domain-containing protein n=1 Tax=Papaver nudicaule TaxID=74823 RepID=A0AA41UWC1_PAPNU|nr:hypothetical protein [Papaver nudicaule]
MRKGKGNGGSRSKPNNNGLLTNSIRIVSSCLKTVTTNATTVATTVRSASASVAASISVSNEDRKDQVLWAGFDKLELGPSTFKHVLLVGYCNGFQVLDVEDASNVTELVSKRDGRVTFLQIQPIPVNLGGPEGFGASQPLLLVVGGEETNSSGGGQGGGHSGGPFKDGNIEPQAGKGVSSPTAVRFYSLRSHSYVHLLRFRSAIYMVRCSPHIVAVGLAAQIYCFDALTLENKFSVLTYPVPQAGIQGDLGVNIGYGPMGVGPRWLAYATNSPLMSNMGRLSPQILTPSPGVSPSTSPGNGSLVARYAMESSKHLAAGLINLGDMGYKTLSRYCQELLPDGSSSPVSSNSSWKVGRVGSPSHSAEPDNAGMVVVKDFVSRAVISQFRAHTSPISALCFDPSGTLLVTASVCGNNINIFRIMPSIIKNGAGTTSYDWSNSHVHLYKMHRGVTTAVIQDICFSQYSQWAAIISSRGTCHIFVISPFGGGTDFQTQSSHSDGPILLPGVSSPWWSTSSFMPNQQSFPPPPPVTLSAVSRIKDGYSKWIKTVSNAAASATGKIAVPSGAIASVFHNSIPRNHSVPSRTNALEHLLVYTPSGHLVQHELVPSLGTEANDGGLRSGLNSPVQQDEELKVKGEPIQWWDVCRKSDWPEREESFSKFDRLGQSAADIAMDTADSEDNDASSVISNSSMGSKDLTKPHERLHWYLSNAEVQISSGRIPIWQKSKISFYTMFNESNITHYDVGGEIDIEKVPSQEVEIRRKDLLPVFDHIHSIKSNWNNRNFVGGRFQSPSFSEAHKVKGKFTEESVVYHSKPSSVVSAEGSNRGSSRTSGSLLDVDQLNTVKSPEHVDLSMNEIGNARSGSKKLRPLLMNPSFSNRDYALSQSGNIDKFDSHVEKSCNTNDMSSLKSNVAGVREPIAEEDTFLSTNRLSSATSKQFSSSPTNLLEEAVPTNLHDEPDFGLFFQEGYCKPSELDESHELTGSATDADSNSSHCERDKPEEGDNDDLLGGIFAFSEEG